MFLVFFLCFCIPRSFVISFGSLFNVTVCSIVLNLYKDNMLIKQDCLLLVGVMDPRNGSLTVAALSSAGPCTVETVQHLILPEALRTSNIAMQKPFN